MAISGNPKRMAQDLAEGYFLITPPLLKQYSAADFKTLLTNLAIVARELRQEAISLDDVMALKFRNMKLSRLNQAEMVIRAFCKKRRILI
jgi:hypothetical protein